jgi:hypothetical protein
MRNIEKSAPMHKLQSSTMARIFINVISVKTIAQYRSIVADAIAIRAAVIIAGFDAER